MLARRALPLRKLAAVGSAAAAALLALVLFVEVTHAGRSYVYCKAMEEVMPHACCKPHQASTAASTIIASSDCCQNHVIPSLGTWTSLSQPVLVLAPLMATVARWLTEALPSNAHLLRLENPLIRSGPTLSRVLAQLMVFRL